MSSDSLDDLASPEGHELSAIILNAVYTKQSSSFRISLTDDDKRIRVLANEFPSLFERRYELSDVLSVTPLAAMCICRASKKTIKAVYRAYPGAISRGSFWNYGVGENYHCGKALIDSLVGESSGFVTPIEIAWATDRKMARCLVQLSTPAAAIPAVDGRMPLHFYLLQKLKLHLEDRKFARMIIDVVKTAPRAAGMLLEHYKYGRGVLPVQVALWHIPTRTTPKIFTRVIEELLLAYPQAVKSRYTFLSSWTRSHSWECRRLLVAHYLSQVDGLPLTYTRLFPLHAILQCHPCYSNPVLKASIKKYRDRLLHWDSKYGCVPIHLHIKRIPLASSTSECEPLLKSLQYMVKVDPRVGLVRDPDTGLYPFQLVAATMSRRFVGGTTNEEKTEGQLLECIYRLLLVSPTTLVSGVLQK